MIKKIKRKRGMAAVGCLNHSLKNRRAMTSDVLYEAIKKLCDTYDFVLESELGRSILGRPIPLLRMGTGERTVLYVGAHHGMEWLTSMILLDFIDELCDAYIAKRETVGLLPDFILRSRSLLFVPMLNPDGVDLAINGLASGGILAERQLRMNGGSTDFSHWQANARGVDLNHNYSYGFREYKEIERKLGLTGGAPTRYSGESSESEPESAAIANLIRTVIPHAIYTFHTQGEEIYCGGMTHEKAMAMARTLSALSGYRLGRAEGPAAYGGLTDYAVEEFSIPSFTIECGKGKNPLPISDAILVYANLRRMLFYSTII